MKRTRINPISKKKRIEINNEKEIRKQLWERCDGLCERCGSSGFPFGLSPHEKEFRSHGGKMSLENSEMLCLPCHGIPHHRKIIIGGINGQYGNKT